MSDMECVKGVLKLIPNIEGEKDCELVISRLLLSNNCQHYLDDGSSIGDALFEYCSDNPNSTQYKLLNGKLYEVLEEVDLNPAEFIEIKERDGLIEYFALWYNGGGCLDEIIEDGMKDLDKKKTSDNN